MMKKLTRTETARFLLEHDHYCILTHRRPDGDTIGSAAALCLGLRSLGKNCHILKNSEVTPRFAWLHEGLTLEEAPEGALLVSVDVASPGMLPDGFKKYLGGIALRIDHHSASTSFTDQELVDGGSASCGEIICDVLEEMGISMDAPLADAIYVAASTDTGCFRFSNTTEHTFAVAAKCAAGGARVYELNQALFETNSLGRLRIQGWIVEHLKLLADGKMAIVSIPRAVEEQLQLTEDDMDNISNFPRTVAGVCMAATLREEGENRIKLSVRAIPGFDATVVATRFGGGGHKGAAGASFCCGLEEAAELVEKAMLELGENA